jgi:hypothetical protein
VTKEMIEARLGNSLDAVSHNQLASLRRVFKSMSDGVGKREDYFKPTPAKPEMAKAPEPKLPDEPDPAEADAGLAPAPATPGAQQTAVPAESKPADPASIATAMGFNPLVSVRNHCKMSKKKEQDLLAYLVRVGSTDGSSATLEEVHMSQPHLLRTIVENWATVAANI